LTRHSPVPRLNERRQDVLRLLAKGLRNSEIGEQLGLPERTVKWYVVNYFSYLEQRTGLSWSAFGSESKGKSPWPPCLPAASTGLVL
jgi:DNA-binding NarL/FixJ family response regulator